jgi:hypothetical protein
MTRIFSPMQAVTTSRQGVERRARRRVRRRAL